MFDIALYKEYVICKGNKVFMKVYRRFYLPSNSQFLEKFQHIPVAPKQSLVPPCLIYLAGDVQTNIKHESKCVRNWNRNIVFLTIPLTHCHDKGRAASNSY